LSRNTPPQQPQPYGQPYPQQGHHGGGYSAPPPPQKRRRVWPWVLLGAVLVPILGFVACTAMVGGAVSAASGPATIRYEISGDGQAGNVTYSTESGVSQEANAALPWTKTAEYGNALFAGLSLSAQRGEGDGSITCKIVNETTGAVLAESTSSGQFAVVSCMGTANEQ
jgi:hypothetical protein